jgi:GntR family transcriptional regulator/MocR family aminotransferase
MWSALLQIETGPAVSRRTGLRQAVVAAIAEGRLAPGQRLPPSRMLAAELGIGRNTVVAVYDALIENGLLAAVPRQGIHVSPDAVSRTRRALRRPAAALDWSTQLARRPTRQRNIVKTPDWQSHPFPFVYGQVDPLLFPLPAWRSLSRAALGRAAVNWWAADHATADDPQLLDAIRRHVLAPRGILVRADEVLVTLGTQHGLYLLAALLARAGTVFGVEDPGYPDARNIAEINGAQVRPLAVDEAGLRPDGRLDGVQVLVVTPGHHCPTMVTMPEARRRALLGWSVAADAVVIEDDYEADACIGSTPPLFSLDPGGRVVHLGSFSKVLAPGLRLGFMVGPAPLIEEARALRRLMHRSVPLNNQRAAALFLAEGHYGALLRRLSAALQRRRDAALTELDRRMPDFPRSAAESGSALWLRCPPGLPGPALFAAASRRGVLVEPGEVFFATPGAGRDFFRLGLSSIPQERIPAGIAALADAAAEVVRQG